MGIYASLFVNHVAVERQLAIKIIPDKNQYFTGAYYSKPTSSCQCQNLSLLNRTNGSIKHILFEFRFEV